MTTHKTITDRIKELADAEDYFLFHILELADLGKIATAKPKIAMILPLRTNQVIKGAKRATHTITMYLGNECHQSDMQAKETVQYSQDYYSAMFTDIDADFYNIVQNLDAVDSTANPDDLWGYVGNVQITRLDNRSSANAKTHLVSMYEFELETDWDCIGGNS